MRLHLIFMTALASCAAFSQELPPVFVCQTLEEVTITHAKTLPARHSRTPDVYRFSEAKLYMSSPGQEEYLYGDLMSAGWLRFTSNYKTIIFDTASFETATEIHTDAQGTRVRRLHCVKS